MLSIVHFEQRNKRVLPIENILLAISETALRLVSQVWVILRNDLLDFVRLERSLVSIARDDQNARVNGSHFVVGFGKVLNDVFLFHVLYIIMCNRSLEWQI